MSLVFTAGTTEEEKYLDRHRKRERELELELENFILQGL